MGYGAEQQVAKADTHLSQSLEHAEIKRAHTLLGIAYLFSCPYICLRLQVEIEDQIGQV